MFSLDDIKQANASMLGHTNRTILFTRVTNAIRQDSDESGRPERETPSLSRLLRAIGNKTTEQFLREVYNDLTVSSFVDFLTKFQPGFYYRLSSGKSIADTATQEHIDRPALLFSLEPGPGWHKARITADHPLIDRVGKLLTQRGRLDIPSERGDRDASLFIRKPLKERETLYRRADDLQQRFERLKNAARQGKESPQTRDAIEEYDRAAGILTEALSELVCTLPTIAYDAERAMIPSAPVSGASPVGILDRSYGAASTEYFIEEVAAARRSANVVGSLLMAGLQDLPRQEPPRKIPESSPSGAKAFHDIYLNSIGRFLTGVFPLFEQIFGIYLLFREMPEAASIPGTMAPEVIIANDYLADLKMYSAELRQFFEMSNAQAANQFRDAISFAVVPQVAPFATPRVSVQRGTTISVDDALFARIHNASQPAAPHTEIANQTPVAGLDEMRALMAWGNRFGFQVLFSPEDTLVAAQATATSLENIETSYAITAVVAQPDAEAGVLCVLDYELIPQGKLIAGETAGQGVEISIDVPQLVARSCFIAAGRLMANDIPACLQYQMRRRGQSNDRQNDRQEDKERVHPDVPGIAVDIGKFPFLREPDLPRDSFLLPASVQLLCAPQKPFAVFTPITTNTSYVCTPRTMLRQSLDNVSQYRPLHLFRQQHYLVRVLRAAHWLARGAALPEDEQQAIRLLEEAFKRVLDQTGWSKSEYVNAFPSALDSNEPFSIRRTMGNTFEVSLHFKAKAVNPLTLTL